MPWVKNDALPSQGKSSRSGGQGPKTLQAPRGTRDFYPEDMRRRTWLFRQFRDPAAYEGKCGRCDYLQVCGGCRARADSYFGTINAGDPGCMFNAQHWEDLLAANAERSDGEALPQVAGVRGYDGCVTTWGRDEET